MSKRKRSLFLQRGVMIFSALATAAAVAPLLAGVIEGGIAATTASAEAATTTTEEKKESSVPPPRNPDRKKGLLWPWEKRQKAVDRVGC